MTGRVRDLVLSLIVAAGLGSGAAFGWSEWREARLPAYPPVGDRVQAALDEFAAGGRVHVAADAHDLLAPEAEARLEQLAADAAHPLWIAVWEQSNEAGHGYDLDAAEQMRRVLDRDGIYIIYSGAGEGQVVEEFENASLTEMIPEDFHGDGARRLEETIAAIDAAELRVHEDTGGYWGGVGGAIAAGALMSLLTIPGALLLVGLGRTLSGHSFRMRGGWW